MSFIYNTICNFISDINNLLWNTVTIIIIFAAGIFLTFRLGFVQFRHPLKVLKSTLFAPRSENNSSEKGISRMQALSTALAASMGTGNIIGVSTAISVGGCGAVFWMILSAFVVMAFAFTENVLGIKYKQLFFDSSSATGPILYIEKGLNSKPLAITYAAACTMASFGIGNAAQANAISGSLDNFGISVNVSGVIFSFLVLFVIFIGGSFIVKLTERIIPFISLFYIIGAVFVIVLYGNNILKILQDIFLSAFGFKQVLGGTAGLIIKQSLTVGLRRGIFSNEAGMGSSVFAHTETDCRSPEIMGMWAMAEVFIDTILCCTLTALVILCTGSDAAHLDGADMIIYAFKCGFGNYAGIFVAVSNTVFAFASILGWYFYGEKCVNYLFHGNVKTINLYKLLYAVTVYFGAVSQLNLIWDLSDIMNAFMMFPNLAAILILSKEAKPYSDKL